MPLKQFNPTSPGRRFMSTLSFEEITKTRPEKSLTESKKRTGGRNSKGQITIWFRGGGHKRRYRIVDFRRDKLEVPAKVAAIEYDPNRSARLALLHYADGEKRYILCPDGLKVGQTIVSGEGRRHPAWELPAAEVDPRRHDGAQHRAAPGQGRPDGPRPPAPPPSSWRRRGPTRRCKLPSGEVRKVHVDCRATVGQVGNIDHKNISIGKAGRTRWLGRRSHNRGVAMNPVDHPHGGGEGKTSGGRHPVTPWGKPTKGYKTRNNKRTQKFIVKRRK